MQTLREYLTKVKQMTNHRFNVAYLAYPYSGDPDNNAATINEIGEHFFWAGIAPIIPHNLFIFADPTDDTANELALIHCLSVLDQVDMVFFITKAHMEFSKGMQREWDHISGDNLSIHMDTFTMFDEPFKVTALWKQDTSKG